MKKNGFTLIEILAVIVIIGLIFGIISPAVSKIVKKSKTTIKNTQLNTILSSAYDYSLKNIYNLPDIGEFYYITLAELKYDGLIEKDIINSETEDSFTDDLLIKVTNIHNNKNIERDKTTSKIYGDYLYEILENNLNSGMNINCGEDLVINLGDDLDEECVITFNDTNVTSSTRLITNYSKNNNLVAKVDTSNYGLYKISYTAIYNDNIINTVRNVVVSDNESPILVDSLTNSEILNFDIQTIGLNVSSFDLKNGIKCIDNSNSCEVITEGSIKFGVSGTYVIWYYAKDSAGNTSTPINRLIKIQ